MIIYNKLDNYSLFLLTDTFLGFEMTANLRDTSPLSFVYYLFIYVYLFIHLFIFFLIYFVSLLSYWSGLTRLCVRTNLRKEALNLVVALSDLKLIKDPHSWGMYAYFHLAGPC